MLLKPTVDSDSLIDIGEDNVGIASGPMAIYAHKKEGIFINGPLSLSSSPQNVTIGGFFKFNPSAATGMPSSSVTPTPTFEVTVPVKNIAAQTACCSIVLSSITGIF